MKAKLGFVAWIVAAVLMVPNVHHGAWAHALLLFAALVLVPLLLVVAEDASATERSKKSLRLAARIQFPAALLLIVSFRLAPGIWAVLWAVPWAAVLLTIAAAGGLRVIQRERHSLPRMCGDAGLIFAAVGAAWLVADRGGIRPLGFSDIIVTLTAVHFHYAGLILPVLAGKALEQLGAPRVAGAIALGVIAGVPAVAIGITASQLQASLTLELVAALLMAVSGMAVAVVHVWLALQDRWPVIVQCLWMVAGCSLFAGMLLAALYGVRSVFAPWPWLDIPWMRALHGTINALGFGLCGTLGWWVAVNKQPLDT